MEFEKIWIFWVNFPDVEVANPTQAAKKLITRPGSKFFDPGQSLEICQIKLLYFFQAFFGWDFRLKARIVL